MLKSGEMAPDFTVKDTHGKDVTLSGLRGKNVVLWFYPKADTPGCTAEGCAFRDLKGDFAKKNAEIFGVSVDPPTDNAAFASKFGFNFPLLCDTDRKVAMAYGAADSKEAATARRAAVIIDPEGKVKHYFPKVSAQEFPKEALGLL